MISKNYLTITNTLRGGLVDALFGNINKNIPCVFPKKIGKFAFFRSLNRDQEQSRMYSLGLYKDKQGKKAFAKMWTGKYKNLAYYTLLNEIVVFQTLSTVTDRESKEIARKFKKIDIPRFIGMLSQENRVILLTDYIENADTIDKLGNKKALSIFIKSFDFLRFIGSKMTAHERLKITKRDTRGIITVYPIVLIKAILAHPELTKFLLAGITVVLKGLPKLLTMHTVNLGHRDLHLKNILLTGSGKIFLIDLQFCVFSNDLYDLFFSLRYEFDNKFIVSNLISLINKRYKDQTNLPWFRALLIISATHGLSGGNIPDRIVKNSVNFLKFSLSRGF